MGNKITPNKTNIEKKTHIHKYSHIDKIFSDFWETRPIRKYSLEEFVDIIMENKPIFEKKSSEDKRLELIDKFMNFNDKNYDKIKTKFKVFLKNHNPYFVLNFIFLTNYNSGERLYNFIEFIYYEFKDLGFQENDYHEIPDFENFVKKLVEEYFILISIYTVKNLLDKKIESVSFKEIEEKDIFVNFTVQKLKESIVEKLFEKNDNDLKQTFIREIPFKTCDHVLIRLALFDMDKRKKKNK
jgi:hypothetical protein